MKTLPTLIIILISTFCIHAQDKKIRLEKELYNFCRCDYLKDSLTTGYHEIYSEKINNGTQLPYIKGSLVSNEHDIMFLRIFYDSTMNIKEEYVKLDADTFHYVKHNDSDNHKVIERGIYYFDKNNIQTDSIYFISYDPNNYDELKETIIYHFYPKVKHGFWIERDSSSSMNGNYLHGKRNGIWHFNYFNVFSTKKVIYQNDNIISEEELNLIKKENNIKELEDVLTDGYWRWSTTDKITSLQRSTNSLYSVTFLKDHTFLRKQYNSRYKGQWKISTKDKTLILDDSIYAIDWFSSKLIQFAPEEK